MSRFYIIGSIRRYARKACLADRGTVGGGLSAEELNLCGLRNVRRELQVGFIWMSKIGRVPLLQPLLTKVCLSSTPSPSARTHLHVDNEAVFPSRITGPVLSGPSLTSLSAHLSKEASDFDDVAEETFMVPDTDPSVGMYNCRYSSMRVTTNRY